MSDLLYTTHTYTLYVLHGTRFYINNTQYTHAREIQTHAFLCTIWVGITLQFRRSEY